MSCYHPLLGIWSGEYTESGKKKYVIRSSVESADFDLEKRSNDSVLIPCGKCIGCRLDYSRTWADRMLLELATVGKGVFVTLTYDNDHIHWSQFDDDGSPLFATLDKRDCQLWMKRLRKKFSEVKIRFFLAGEYGPSTARPHYHAILFGIGLDDLGYLYEHGRNDLGQRYYISPVLCETWPNGFVLVSDVSYETCAYVARYVTKKLSGPLSIDYAVRNVCPEFSLMSRKPGIGAEYLKEHPDCLDYVSINLSTPTGGKKISIPKYFLRQLKEPSSEFFVLKDESRYDSIVSQRLKFAEDQQLMKLQEAKMSLLDYLSVEEANKKAQIKVLKRKDLH